MHYLLLYMMLTIYQIFFYQDQEHQVKDSEYVPKSKRNSLWLKATPMITWIQDKIKIIGEKVISSTTDNTRRKRLKNAYRITRNSQNVRSTKLGAIMVFAAVAMSTQRTTHHDNKVVFDTDAEPIGIDNRCTGCISHRIEDFDGPLIDSNRAIKGFGGSKTTNVKIGTITWKWLDDNGQSHKFVIPKSFYVPSGNVRLISPQHWAQTQQSKSKGIGSETLHDKVTLFWNDRKNTLTIPLGKQDNVATFYTAPGYRKFEAFCSTAELNYAQEQEDPIIADETLIVSDDDDDVLFTNESANLNINRLKRGKRGMVSTNKYQSRL
jgi:hypothetical protein